MNTIEIQADLAAPFTHLPAKQRESISATVLAAARAFVAVETANDALDPLIPVIDQLPAATQTRILQARQAVSEAAEDTWQELQDPCFAHNIDSAAVLIAVRAERDAAIA